MSTLVLELRQGDMMVVNGAPIRFRNRARIELTAKARFLFGKQIMPPEQAITSAISAHAARLVMDRALSRQGRDAAPAGIRRGSATTRSV